MAKTVKLNITIPTELAERLDRYRPGFNISAAATKGIQRELDALESITTAKVTYVDWEQLTEEVARLRAELDSLKLRTLT